MQGGNYRYTSQPPPPPNPSWNMNKSCSQDWVNVNNIPQSMCYQSNKMSSSNNHPSRPVNLPVDPNPNLYIHNVPKDATEEELKDLFSPYGSVVKIRLKVNQKIGPQALYAFVTFESTAEAQLALQQLNGYDMRSRRLRIEFQRSKSERSRSEASNYSTYDAYNDSNKYRFDTNVSRGKEFSSHRERSKRYVDSISSNNNRHFQNDTNGANTYHSKKQRHDDYHSKSDHHFDKPLNPYNHSDYSPTHKDISHQSNTWPSSYNDSSKDTNSNTHVDTLLMTVYLYDLLHKIKPELFKNKVDSLDRNSQFMNSNDNSHHLSNVDKMKSYSSQIQPFKPDGVNMTKSNPIQHPSYNQYNEPYSNYPVSNKPYTPSHYTVDQFRVTNNCVTSNVEPTCVKYNTTPSNVHSNSPNPVWHGYLARNARRRIPVNVHSIFGNCHQFLAQETQLNISHRSSWEEVSKKKIVAMCYIVLSDTELVVESGALVSLTPQKQMSYEKCFQDHIDYLKAKERAGVVAFGENKHLYIIPQNSPLYDQYITENVPCNVSLFLGLFTISVFPSNVSAPSTHSIPINKSSYIVQSIPPTTNFPDKLATQDVPSLNNISSHSESLGVHSSQDFVNNKSNIPSQLHSNNNALPTVSSKSSNSQLINVNNSANPLILNSYNNSQLLKQQSASALISLLSNPQLLASLKATQQQSQQ